VIPGPAGASTRSSTPGATLKSGPVFLDSGIYIAFLDRSDRYHPHAVRLFTDVPRRWFSSLAVVSETYGWFIHRLGEEGGRTFRLALADLPRLTLLPLDMVHHVAVVEKLERLRGRKLTYVDATSLVFLTMPRIGEVWGTDRDLALEGARVVPLGR
jgi:predicted nucleic acid-binding protein